MPDTPQRFLSLGEIAERLGLQDSRSLSSAHLPAPDAMIGKYRGWRPDTIDAWQASRPGKGAPGATRRPRAHQDGN